MTLQEMYEQIPEFKDYVHKFIETQANHNNYITVSEALTYAMVGEYAAYLLIHLNIK